jgi:hypothetical protein
MSKPRYRALRIVLGSLAFLLAIGGVLMILSNKPLIMRLFMHPPEPEISTLLLAALKEMGGIVLMLSVMLFFSPPATPSAMWRSLTRSLWVFASLRSRRSFRCTRSTCGASIRRI